MIDLDRPDIGKAPKMQAIADSASARFCKAPYIRVATDDNLCSSVSIRGSFDTEWSGGIFQNSRYFYFSICPSKGKRYYDPATDDKVTVELDGASYKIEGKFRKYTGPPEKCIARIAKWIFENSI
jgi:hypothetical protein